MFMQYLKVIMNVHYKTIPLEMQICTICHDPVTAGTPLCHVTWHTRLQDILPHDKAMTNT
jgi:hypothetical protein